MVTNLSEVKSTNSGVLIGLAVVVVRLVVQQVGRLVEQVVVGLAVAKLG